ncbi:MAG: RusA family crossover junction endodeoxyribonuclease [Selenomonadaceae bacterium]|nr:RusA family crossover junction endodeoxyribonuclease [Selenomonadaceae bacterium]
MIAINFTVAVEPIPQPRPRFSRFGVYEPAAIKKYKNEISQAAKSAMKKLQPLTGELSAVIKLYRKFKRSSRRFGDCDNHAKAICDACNKIIYADDSQIVRCVVEKFTDKLNPRVEVEISEIGE